MEDTNDYDATDLTIFLIFTFVFSWTLWIPSLLSSFGLIEHLLFFNGLRVLGSFGPFIVAFSLTLYRKGFVGVRALWKRGWHYENGKFLYISLFLIPLLSYFSISLASISEGDIFTKFKHYEHFGEIVIESIFTFFFGGPFQEEFGWRGYALDQLQLKWTALESSITVGGIWSMWHFPLFFIVGSAHYQQIFFGFITTTMILSILWTWVYNNTGRSILMMMIIHTSYNMSVTFLPLNATVLGQFYFIIMLDILLVIILFIYGTDKLVRNSKKYNIIKRE